MTLREILNEYTDHLINHQGKTKEQIEREADNRANRRPTTSNSQLIILTKEFRTPIVVDGSTYTPSNPKSPFQLARFAKEGIKTRLASAKELEELFDTTNRTEIKEQIYELVNEYGKYIACLDGSWDWVQIPKSAFVTIANHLKETK